jgi:pyruvate carboxylase
VRALAAWAAGIPTLRSHRLPAPDELVAGAEDRFPVFVKAVAGGGGRGMRRVDDPKMLRESVAQAMREAEGACGNPTAFIEQAVGRPRHIEVQILADTYGTTLHLYERDCSLQRRHQKVIEIAPAPHITDELRAALCRDAVTFAESIDYSCAGTVEFLVETEGPRAGQHVFIEMNPRIQVEHTVTEELSTSTCVSPDADRVRRDHGRSRSCQDVIRINGAALRCRIPTADPANGFPDTGTISAYRLATARAYGWTAARSTPASRSARTSTRCWSS